MFAAVDEWVVPITTIAPFAIFMPTGRVFFALVMLVSVGLVG
jgi:hypothetical protein